MNTLSEDSLRRAFPSLRSVISDRFMRSNGWLTNGFLMIREALEPKSSVNKAIEKLESKDTVFYEEAAITNHLRVGCNRNFTVKLKSEHFECWVDPKFLNYIFAGVEFVRNHKVMIGESFADPILVVNDSKDILGIVMPFRRTEGNDL